MIFSIQVFAGWVQADNQWKYEQNGVILTNYWIEDQGAWYYVGADGIMLANTTQKIDGVNYSFDTSGKSVQLTPIQTGVTEGRYYNEKFRYSVQLPEGIPYKLDGDFIELEQEFLYIGLGNIKSGTPAEDAKAFRDEGLTNINSSLQLVDETEVQYNGLSFTRLHMKENSVGFCMDIYTSVQNDGYIFITTAYAPQTSYVIENFFNSINRIP